MKTKRRVFTVIFIFLLILNITFIEVEASPNPWTEKTPMNYARQYPAVAVVNNKIYVIGGRAGSKDGGTRYKYNEMYEPETDTWSIKTPIPVAFDAAAVTVYNDKIYIAGGFPNGKKHYVYDTNTDSWNGSPTDLPVVRWDCGGVRIGQYFYVIGGSTDKNAKDTLYYYDLVNGGNWVKNASSMYQYAKVACSVHNGKIYVFTSNWAVIHKHVEVYDPSTDNWTILNDAPYQFIAATPTSIDGYIYLLRASAGSDNIPNFFRYDPETDSYTALDDLDLVDSLSPTLSLVFMNEAIYHCGGTSPSGYKTNKVFAWKISTPGEKPFYLLNVHTFKNDLPIVSNISLFDESRVMIETVKNVSSYKGNLTSRTYYVQASVLYNEHIYTSDQIKVNLVRSTELAIYFLFGNLSVLCLDVQDRPLENCTVILTRENEERIGYTDNSGLTFLEAYYGKWTIEVYWMTLQVGGLNITVTKTEVEAKIQCNIGDFAVIVVNQYGDLIKANVILANTSYGLTFTGQLDGIIENLTLTHIPLINYTLTIEDDFENKTYFVDTAQTRQIKIEVIMPSFFETPLGTATVSIGIMVTIIVTILIFLKRRKI